MAIRAARLEDIREERMGTFEVGGRYKRKAQTPVRVLGFSVGLIVVPERR
jgi:hypothetical protein